jgi:DNA-directed RNA polymerase specialized sigma24 family protein
MVRAFMLLGTSHGAPVHPKAWLFRVASNRWLNMCKQRREEPTADVREEKHTPVDPKSTREAAGSLVVGLAPRERAANRATTLRATTRCVPRRSAAGASADRVDPREDRLKPCLEA